ncbi:MAG: hypothetical protein ACI93L_002820 [Cyclobacteriaceae bacterium]|jgi:hypothetical protein
MQFIWFNPDLGKYEKGSKAELEQASVHSVNQDRFDVIYEFSDTSQRIIDKVLESLNVARLATAS